MGLFDKFSRPQQKSATKEPPAEESPSAWTRGLAKTRAILTADVLDLMRGRLTLDEGVLKNWKPVCCWRCRYRGDGDNTEKITRGLYVGRRGQQRRPDETAETNHDGIAGAGSGDRTTGAAAAQRSHGGASTAAAKPRRWPSWRSAIENRAVQCCWPRATPFAPPRSTSSGSGPNAAKYPVVAQGAGADPAAVVYDALQGRAQPRH